MSDETVIINGQKYPCWPGKVPKYANDLWVRVFGIVIEIKDQAAFEEFTRGANNYDPSLFSYPRTGERTRHHRATIEQIKILQNEPTIKANVVYQLKDQGDA